MLLSALMNDDNIAYIFYDSLISVDSVLADYSGER